MSDKDSERYSVPSDENFEPGSNSQVLKNYLGIKTKKEVEQIESEKLEETVLTVMERYDEDHQFTASDVCAMHKLWLSEIYLSLANIVLFLCLKMVFHLRLRSGLLS